MRNKTSNLPNPSQHNKGVTLIEMVVVISVILVLVSIATMGTTTYRNWKAGLEAGESMKAVYQAQKMYLADNPTTAVGTIVATDIEPYLPNGMAAIPAITGLDGAAKVIDLTTSPPTLNYDPSGSTSDGLWDVGNH